MLFEQHIAKAVEADPDGIEIEFDSVDSLLGALSTSEHMQAWIYRGQAVYDWGLQSRVQRELEASGVDKGEWRDVENRLLRFFREQVSSSLPRPPEPGDLLGWLSVMQQYRAPTRLLDWSESPFVALFFACAEYINEDEVDGAIWALNAGAVRALRGSAQFAGWDEYVLDRTTSMFPGGKKEVSIKEPGNPNTWNATLNNQVREFILDNKAVWFPLKPPQPDSRMVAQQAVFTVDTSFDLSIKTMIEELVAFERNFRREHPPPAGFAIGPPRCPRDFLLQIRIRGSWRRAMLNALEKMNITPATLFPGADGAGYATLLRLRTGAARSLRDILLP